jgi:hypothetical protein
MTRSPQQSYGGVFIENSNVAAETIIGVNNHVSAPDSQLEKLLDTVKVALSSAPPEKRAPALGQFDQLRAEVSKGSRANDSAVAKLLDGLVGLVPTAVSSIVSAFSHPVLAAAIGPVTKFVLEKFGSSESDKSLSI